jgi:hypothetical protein
MNSARIPCRISVVLSGTFPFAVAILAAAFPHLAHAAIIADSVSDFSGTQGQAGWYYGYYTSPFTQSTFQQFPYFMPDDWLGNTQDMWEETRGVGGYYTSLVDEGGHPEGAITTAGRVPVSQWAVRRWVSTVSGNVTIAGALADLDTSASGVIGYIILDGNQVWSQTVSNGNNPGPDNGISYSITENVQVGSIIDFGISTNGPYDQYDSTYFTATISELPEPASLALFAAGGMCLLGRRRRKMD